MRRPPLPLAAVALVVAVALVAAGCAGLGEGSGIALTPESDREDAPAFTAPALDGDGSVSLADHRGAPVVLNFWASWCGPCREETPALVEFAGRHPEVRVVGLAVTDAPRDSRRFAARYGVRFPLGIDRRGDIAARFGVTGLPVTVVVDERGRVATTIFGPVDRDDLEGLADSVS